MKKTQNLEQFRASLITPLPLATSRYVIENMMSYDLDVSPSEIWPYLCDTSRMNKELGFAPRTEKEVSGELLVTTKTLGRFEEWIEKPWEWVEQQELQNLRVFKRGWMTEQRGVFKVYPTDSGCRVVLFFRWSFSNPFTKALFSGVGGVFEKKFKAFFDEKVALIKTGENQKVSESPNDIKAAFLNYLHVADELDLDRLHLKKISGILNVPLSELLVTTHELVKEGSLTMSWDVVCPHCRGVRSENSRLSFIQLKNTCEACDVEFELEVEESVEVVFHLTPKIRTIQKVVYCAAEPAKKKHIKLTQVIEPQCQREFQLELRPGLYKLRGKGNGAVGFLEVDPTHESKDFVWSGLESKRVKINNSFSLRVANPSSLPMQLTLEEAWWFHDRLMPREVLSHPLFRTLFSEDHLNVGLKLHVGHQVILFTDIVGSTPLYKESGDAKALKVVQDHYVEVSEIITSFKGVVVKFIGDAIMAAFLDMEDAYRASVAINEVFHRERKDTPIRLRISFHQGEVLCANMNVGLDYFGNTVNQAAKIQKWAGAHEIGVVQSDFVILKEKFPELSAKEILDEKLGLTVRILEVKPNF